MKHLLTILLVLVAASVGATYREVTQADLPVSVNRLDTILLTGTGDTIYANSYVDVGGDKVFGFRLDAGDDTVLIDGGGKVLKFATDSTDYPCAIRMWGTPVNPITRVTIRNLHIYRDTDDTLDNETGTESGSWISGVKGAWWEYVKFDTVDFTLDGYAALGIYCVETQHNVVGFGCEVNGGHYKINSNSFNDRQYWQSGAIRFPDGFGVPPDTATYHLKVRGVHVIKSPHFGIAFWDMHTLIQYCTLLVDAQNVKYDTLPCCTYEVHDCGTGKSADNAFVITNPGCNTYGFGSKIEYNYIRSGQNHQGARGILLENVHSPWNNPTVVKGNNILVSQASHCERIPERTYGIRWRHIDGGINGGIQIINNIVGIMVDTIRGNAIGEEGGALNGDYDPTYGPDSFLVANNTVFCSTLTAGSQEANAIEIGADVVTSGAPLYWSLRGNIIRSGGNCIYFAEGGNNFSGHDITFEACTLRYQSGTGDYTYRMDEDAGTYGCEDLVVIDMVYQNGTDPTDVFWDQEGDLRYEEHLQVYVKDQNADPVSGATVTIDNAYGNYDYSGSTDANGYDTTLAAYRHDFYGGGTDSFSYNPYRVIVSKSGVADTVDLNLSAIPDSDKVTLTLVLGEAPAVVTTIRAVHLKGVKR